MYVSDAQIKTARSGVTWLTKNAHRRGLRERSERGPSRRAFLVSQVTPGKAQYDQYDSSEKLRSMFFFGGSVLEEDGRKLAGGGGSGSGDD
ncbi:hypothetical protein TYRP_016764 [Tyrophagus putrescentiae]|nr:hypothetical protein TYRP_016764 [Tyrophagus putrescentiae]